MSERAKSTVEGAVSRLRQLAIAAEPYSLIGSEDSLLELLGVSRATIRQVARVLEREGFVRVRRGINGGYFAERPTLETVEASVSTYLAALDMDVEDVTAIASLLWVEAVRKAALVHTDAVLEVASNLRRRVMRLRSDASLVQILEVERASRSEIFALTNARYIELIFRVNIAFAMSRFPVGSGSGDPNIDAAFLKAWRKGKVMELEAIGEGDADLAVIAARHVRNLWHGRIWRPGTGLLRPGRD